MNEAAALATLPAAHGHALSNVGRADLENLVVGLRVERDEYVRQAQEAIAVAARAEDARHLMEGTLTATQAHCTQQLEELRVWRRSELEPLARAIAIARTKHPKGCELPTTLIEEVGEVCRAMRRESTERVREELLDVAVVAVRLFLGETVSLREPR